MNWQIAPLCPADAKEALALLKTLSDNHEVLYKPLEEADFLSRFFGEKRWGFTARTDDGRLIGWIHGAAKTSFLEGETHENTPLYLTMLLVDAAWRRQGVGSALLEALKKAGVEAGKKAMAVSGDNPVHLTWLIPGAGGHDHNNAPGVDEDGMGFAFFQKHGFKDDFHEISLYMNLKDYKWDPKLDEMIAKLNAEGIHVGRWQMGMGEECDGMCDRVGSEYWRQVLREETAKENPRPILAAVTDGHIVGFTGPVDRQENGRGWFTGICTDPLYEKRGIAGVLFNDLMGEFIKVGAAYSTLFTGTENHAQRLYLKTGCQPARYFAIMKKTVEG